MNRLKMSDSFGRERELISLYIQISGPSYLRNYFTVIPCNTGCLAEQKFISNLSSVPYIQLA